MPKPISRRTFLTGASTIAAAVVVPVSAQATSSDVQQELGAPLSPEVEKILKTNLENQKKTTADRLKFKLPENSEPCFTYIATEVEK